MFRLILAACYTVTLGMGSGAWAAGVTNVSVNINQMVSSPRWVYEKNLKPTGGTLLLSMINVKRAQAEKDRVGCVASLNKIYIQGKSLGPWVALNHLQCAQIREKSGAASLAALKSAIARVDTQPPWLVSGPWVPGLKSAYASALLMLGEQQVKTERRAAWKTLDRLQQIESWLSAEERALLYKMSGELAFVDQNLLAAQSFMQRSLNERDNPELREKMKSIGTTLLGTKSSAKASPKQTVLSSAVPPQNKGDDLGISDDERNIFARMNRSYESQDYVAAIEDGVELLQNYPGSRRANDAADRILEIYLGLVNKSEEKFRHVRETVVRQMAKVDGARMSRWAQMAYARGHYSDALSLAESAYEKLAGHPDGTKVILLAGKAAVACGEYDEASTHLTEVIKRHGGTVEAAEANFRLGLLRIRAKQYPQAAAYFERLLALSSGKDFEYRALYWQWRARQKIDPTSSTEFAKRLIDRYPHSYYALRAMAELNRGVIEFKNIPVNLKLELRFLDSERLAWERLNILLRAGWIKEAEEEIQFLPEPQTAEERLVRSKLWGSVLRYDLATQEANKAFEENAELRQVPMLKLIFPQEFSTYIIREAKLNNLDADWVRSLIRQESTFRPVVRSSANALGLMQLLPSTADEMARDLKLKNFKASEALFEPDVNIKLGTAYLARMIRMFRGHTPLALAAYNAGPTRLRRWLNARNLANPLEAGFSSAPEAEIWIDELPWEETSFYVKAILRNWLIYRLLDGSKVTLNDPMWVDAPPQAR